MKVKDKYGVVNLKLVLESKMIESIIRVYGIYGTDLVDNKSNKVKTLNKDDIYFIVENIEGDLSDDLYSTALNYFTNEELKCIIESAIRVAIEDNDNLDEYFNIHEMSEEEIEKLYKLSVELMLKACIEARDVCYDDSGESSYKDAWDAYISGNQYNDDYYILPLKLKSEQYNVLMEEDIDNLPLKDIKDIIKQIQDSLVDDVDIIK